MVDDKRLQEFESAVDGWVSAAVNREVVKFEALVMELPGVYPSEVVRSLKRLAVQGTLNPTVAASIIDGSRQPFRRAARSPSSLGLPVEHPLDFEWRFSTDAVDRLLGKCRVRLERTSRRRIAIVGAPSVAARVLSSGLGIDCIVLDSNREVIASLRKRHPGIHAMRCDVLREDPSLAESDLVIADPPWYPDHMRSFLWTCCKLCACGGHVVLCLPPMGCRPGIHQEVVDLLAWGRRLGMVLVGFESGTVTYDTPLFEFNALTAEGILCIPASWRRGDLAVFARTEHLSISRPQPPPDGELWSEVRVGRVRVRLRDRGPVGFDDPGLIEVTQGHVLASVSRRDPRRRLADVWTSGNRIFGCRSPRLLGSILRAISGDDDVEAMVASALKRELTGDEIDKIQHARRRAEKLLDLEEYEHARYYGDASQTERAARN